MPDLDEKQKMLAAISKEIEGIEEDIAQLRNSYEQYFLGLERKPPTKEHADLKKRVLKVKNQFFIRGTALKFKVQALEQKFQSYDRLWARTMMEIENGTYRRDLSKVRRKASEPARPAEQKADAAQAPVSQPSAPAQAAARPAPPPPSQDSTSDAKMRAVYDAYLVAKRRCAEDVSKLNFETVATTLRKQVPDLLKKHNAKEIDFKVVIKDGKAVLRAVPK